MKLLGEYNDHPVGWLRGVSDPVMSHLSTTSSPLLAAKVVLIAENV